MPGFAADLVAYVRCWRFLTDCFQETRSRKQTFQRTRSVATTRPIAAVRSGSSSFRERLFAVGGASRAALARRGPREFYTRVWPRAA